MQILKIVFFYLFNYFVKFQLRLITDCAYIQSSYYDNIFFTILRQSTLFLLRVYTIHLFLTIVFRD